VCSARDEDARGIPVLRDVCREEAAAVLRNYAEGGGEICNARQGD
jgi:CO/xanthine dehydrogenase FAD-binding subunit